MTTGVRRGGEDPYVEPGARAAARAAHTRHTVQ
jgi:hypothetical protein